MFVLQPYCLVCEGADTVDYTVCILKAIPTDNQHYDVLISTDRSILSVYSFTRQQLQAASVAENKTVSCSCYHIQPGTRNRILSVFKINK